MSAPVIVFVVCAAACAVAHVAILVSTMVRTRGVEPSADVPRPRRAVEFAWALVPILALALLLTATWGRVRERRTAPIEIGRRDGDLSDVATIGRRLYTDYAFAFEVTSILILVAMLGAVVLARREQSR